MVAKPISFRCKIRILSIKADPAVSERSVIDFILEESPPEADGNSFFEKGKMATGTISGAMPAIKPETIAFADVTFQGNPFHENFRLSNLVIG